MPKTVVEYLYKYAKETPEKIAVISEDKKTTYSELAALAHGYASFLSSKCLKKGNIAVVRASQTLDYVVAYLAVHTVGGVIAPVEKNIPADGLISIAKSIGAKLIISTEDTSDSEFIFLNSVDILTDAANVECIDFDLPNENDSADILFTTGTTGKSKAVEISHKALVATAKNLIYGCQYKKDTVIIVPGPLNHANPIRKVITTIVNGSTIYLLNGMTNINAFYSALDNSRGLVACCLPPAMVRTLFALSGDTLGRYSERIDFIENSTAPLPEPDKLKLCSLLPKTRLYNNYGSSEAASVCMYDYNKYPSKNGCIGMVMPESEILVVDDNHSAIKSSRDNVGCIACAGNTIMKRYVNEPELTDQVLKNGIIYTNDVGYIDDDGFVYIIGRRDDVINVGGLKVAPSEVENVALEFSGVDDCICISIPNLVSGCALKLLVVMKDDAEYSTKNIAAFLKSKLESYKVPMAYEQVDKIRRTYNGKLDRKSYRQ